MTRIVMITDNAADVEVDGRSYKVTAEEWGVFKGVCPLSRDGAIKSIAEQKAYYARGEACSHCAHWHVPHELRDNECANCGLDR